MRIARKNSNIVLNEGKIEKMVNQIVAKKMGMIKDNFMNKTIRKTDKYFKENADEKATIR